MSKEDRKHNWFTLDGDIRIDENLTAEEFIKKLDELGLEFLGRVGVSEFKDEDYE